LFFFKFFSPSTLSPRIAKVRNCLERHRLTLETSVLYTHTHIQQQQQQQREGSSRKIKEEEEKRSERIMEGGVGGCYSMGT